MTRTHLITGATGFIGGALVLELLQRTDDRLICLTRSNSRHSAADRLSKAISAAAAAYDLEHLVPAAAERCVAVEADLLHENCGVNASALGQIDHIWHCAASLEYKDSHRQSIWSANVDGTAHVLQLAEKLGNPPLVYVSTAYVAGNRSGPVAEGPVVGSTHLNNWYERSKVAAEALVQDSGIADWRIARPSIVIGHSVTKQATSFTGMYGFLRELLRFERKVTKELGSFLSFRPVRIIGEPECLLNFIPVDAVARSLVRIGLGPALPERHFHLADLMPPTVRDAIALFFDVVGFAPPIWVPSEDYLSSIDDRLNKELDFYKSYLRNSKSFSAQAALRHVDQRDLMWELEPAQLRPYAQWYVDRFRRPGSERVMAATPVSQ